MIFYSSIETIYFLLPLIGFLVGLFGTMLGGGGGFFFLPIRTLIIGVPAQTAVLTSLVATLPICLVGTMRHYRQGNVNSMIGFAFSLTGIIGALIGVTLVGSVSSEQLKLSFGVYSILIAINMVVSTVRNKKEKCSSNKKHSMLGRIKGPFFGFFAGLITGSFGTSGTAPILAGLFTMNIPLKMVIGTSLMVVLINTLFAIGAHSFVGTVDLTLVAFLTIGSIAGALIGPSLLAKTKTNNAERKIKYIYAFVIVGIGVAMLLG